MRYGLPQIIELADGTQCVCLEDFLKERDELREELEILRSNKMSDPLLATTFKHLIRERYEAREAAAKWESSSDAMERAGAEQARRADENREWALKAEKERDEARQALLRIEEIFVDGDDTYEDWKAMGDIARKALEAAR